jgi:two-component system sensor histidine kinase KdpD
MAEMHMAPSSTSKVLKTTEEETEALFYGGTGPLLALLLGMSLTPLRGYTSASNFTFAFLVLTIAVAELGGRWPALATALASALSLDFFLTQPYLRLTIDDKHDVIAFFGLAGCGLVAALLGSRRRERIRELGAARRQLDFLRAALTQAEGAGPFDHRLAVLLSAARDVFPIARAVVRGIDDDVVAATPKNGDLAGVPAEVLELEPLSRPGDAAARWLSAGLALPPGGGRVELLFDDRRRGWLDLWGDGRPLTPESRRGIRDLARLLALLIATRRHDT